MLINQVFKYWYTVSGNVIDNGCTLLENKQILIATYKN